jgi:hypothetical protein
VGLAEEMRNAVSEGERRKSKVESRKTMVARALIYCTVLAGSGSRGAEEQEVIVGQQQIRVLVVTLKSLLQLAGQSLRRNIVECTDGIVPQGRRLGAADVRHGVMLCPSPQATVISGSYFYESTRAVVWTFFMKQFQQKGLGARSWSYMRLPRVRHPSTVPSPQSPVPSTPGWDDSGRAGSPH